MRITIKKKLVACFGAMTLLFVGFGIVVLHSMSDVQEKIDFVIERDAPAIANAHRLLKLVVDMETGQRGFCIVQKEEFLEPYNSAVEEFGELLEVEKDLVSDNPSQAKVLERIDDLVRQWHEKAAEPEIAARREMNKNHETLKDVAALLEAGTGKRLLDEIRAQFAKFITVEEELSTQRCTSASQTYLSTRTLTLSLIVCSAILGFVMSTLIVHTISNSICKLVKGTEIVGSGNLGYRIDIKNRDEIGELAASFNQMLDKREQAEIRFRTLYESSGDAIMVLGEKCIIDCNTQTLAFFGVESKEAFCKLHPADLSPPEQADGTDSLTAAGAHIETALRQGGNRFEWLHRRADTGEVFEAEVLLTPMELDGKQVLQASVHDITERKRTEEALRENLQRLEFALQGGELGMWDWNPEDDAVVYNNSWAQILEYRPDELEPTVDFFKQHIHPEDMAAVFDRLTGHVEGRLPVYESEHRLRTKSGRWLWVLDRGKIVERDKDGCPVRVTGIIADITDRKRSEEALRESEARFMKVLYASDDAILLIGDNTFIDCNEATVSMLGYDSREQFLQTHPSELSPETQPDGRSSLKKADEMMRLAFDRGFHRFEWIHLRANGEEFPVEVSLTRIAHKGRHILYCIWRDITEHKASEAEREKTIAEMERMNRLMIGREMRIIEMKKEVNALLTELGREPQYGSVLEGQEVECSSDKTGGKHDL